MEKRKLKMNPFLTIIILLLFSILSMLLALEIQPGNFETVWNNNLETPILFWLNYLPMLLTILFLYILLGNVFYSGSLTILIWGILSYINLIKIQGRGDPFVPGDIMMFTEAVDAVNNYDMDLNVDYLFLIFGLSIIAWMLGMFIKSTKPFLLIRVVFLIAICGLVSDAMQGLYADKELYEELPGPLRVNIPQVYEAFGFPYMFVYNFNLNPIDKPENYDKELAAEYEAEFIAEKTYPKTKPNIIMVMCEAFTDMPNEAVFSYGEKENPIAFYNSLIKDNNVISGHMIVSNTGAGTANTEFDVLTGMMTNKIAVGTTSAFRTVRKNMGSISNMLKGEGYETLFMHPGNSWTYNRESVYKYFGIDDQIFIDDFQNNIWDGGWISDDSFYKELRERLEERKSEAPIFVYGVTVQNHQAYTEEKYGYIPDRVPAKAVLSEEASNNLSVYFKGLKDSDVMLSNLTKYLNQQTEPYLLVFFGDHQPALGVDYLTYRELGLYPENEEDPEQYLSLYDTPFLIWGNNSYLANHDMNEIKTELGISEDYIISSHYLGALTSQVAGFNGIDGYIDYVNQLRTELPVHSIYGSRLPDGTWVSKLPEDLQEKEDLRWRWQYYRLREEKVE